MLSLLLVALIAQTPATVSVSGEVTQPLTVSVADLAAFPQRTVTASAHDQKGTYTGVALRDILTKAGVAAGADLRGPHLAKYVVVTGADGYKAVFALAELDPLFTDRVVVLATQKDGGALAENARPFQVIVPGDLRPARWVRQVVSISVQSARP
jgi:DMSO/TMAO reductase YedYZ molybdopterin-dependent catalytic subunit